LVEGQSISPHKNALSLVTSMSDSELLQCNLLASPCPDPRCRHEVTLVKNCASAAAGLDIAIKRAEHEYVVCVHQDVYLPDGWDRCVMQQFQEAEGRFGPVGVAGVYGVGEVIEADDSTQPLGAARIGWVVDRGRLLRDGPELPARVATLDELLLVVRRDSGLRFDPDLGFHLYGADICLRARERGLANPHAEFNSSGSVTMRYLDGLEVDELFARTSSSGATTWYITDKLGSVEDLVSSSGPVLDHITYDSFGNIATQTNASYTHRFMFAGMEYDSGTGLYYDHARYL
jgi:Glycosyltransferase like family